MKKILIADDEDILRMLIVDTLEDDYEIDEAKDGLEASQKIKDKNYDLVILDFMMPHLTGLEVLKAMRKDQNQTPVLMLTAKTQDADRNDALSMGADYFMPKPFSPLELHELVKSILY